MVFYHHSLSFMAFFVRHANVFWLVFFFCIFCWKMQFFCEFMGKNKRKNLFFSQTYSIAYNDGDGDKRLNLFFCKWWLQLKCFYLFNWDWTFSFSINGNCFGRIKIVPFFGILIMLQVKRNGKKIWRYVPIWKFQVFGATKYILICAKWGIDCTIRITLQRIEALNWCKDTNYDAQMDKTFY